MKILTFGLLILSFLFTSSCKKNSSDSPANAGNSLTFKGVTYNFTSVIADSATSTLTAYTSTTPLCVATIRFATFSQFSQNDQTLYYVTADNMFTGPNDFSVNINIASGIYTSTGNYGANQSTYVYVKSGKLSIPASGIKLVNITNPADSAAASFNIIQTQ